MIFFDICLSLQMPHLPLGAAISEPSRNCPHTEISRGEYIVNKTTNRDKQKEQRQTGRQTKRKREAQRARARDR